MAEKTQQLTVSQRKQQTTELVHAKVKALRRAITKRKRDRFRGLPKSVETFAKWQGEEPGESLSQMNRQTIESRPDLKSEIWAVLSERKAEANQRANLAEKDKKIKDLEQKLAGLAGKNHELHASVEALQRELDVQKNKIKSLEQDQIPRAGQVIGIRERQ